MEKKGLSLIEILISLAILTVITLATLPMITVKMHDKLVKDTSASGIWNAPGGGNPALLSGRDTDADGIDDIYPNLIIGATDTDAEVNALDWFDAALAGVPSVIRRADKNAESGRLFIYNRGQANKDLPAINITRALYFLNNIIDGSVRNTLTITNDAAGAKNEERYLTLSPDEINIRNRLIVQKPKVVGGVYDAGTGNIVISGNNINNLDEVGDNTIIGNTDSNLKFPGRNGALYIFAGQTTPIVEADSNMIHITAKLQLMPGVSGTKNIIAQQLYLASDKRLKNIKGEYKKSTNEILKINPVEFTYKTDKENTVNIGVIAQDLKKVLPEAVIKRDDGYYAVKEAPVFYALLNSVKELNSNYEKIKKNNDELEKQIALLKLKK